MTQFYNCFKLETLSIRVIRDSVEVAVYYPPIGTIDVLEGDTLEIKTRLKARGASITFEFSGNQYVEPVPYGWNVPSVRNWLYNTLDTSGKRLSTYIATMSKLNPVTLAWESTIATANNGSFLSPPNVDWAMTTGMTLAVGVRKVTWALPPTYPEVVLANHNLNFYWDEIPLPATATTDANGEATTTVIMPSGTTGSHTMIISEDTLTENNETICVSLGW